MHANGTFGLATTTEQTAQCKMQFDGMRVDLDGIDKGLDGAIRLFVEQEIEALEIRTRQRTRLLDQMLDIDACSRPAQSEEERKKQELPVFEFNHLVDAT